MAEPGARAGDLFRQIIGALSDADEDAAVAWAFRNKARLLPVIQAALDERASAQRDVVFAQAQSQHRASAEGLAFARDLAEAIQAAGLQAVRAWAAPGQGARVYLPGQAGYLAVGLDGTVSTLVRGQRVYDPAGLYPSQQKAVKQGIKAYLDARRAEDETSGPYAQATLHETYSARAIPQKGDRKYRSAEEAARAVMQTALHYVEDPDLGAAWASWAGEDEDADALGFTRSDLPDLLGVPSHDAGGTAFTSSQRVQIADQAMLGASQVRDHLIPGWLAETSLADVFDGLRIRLTPVPIKVAADFIATHHSALPFLNPRGLMYALGVVHDGRLVAVATAGTPTGRWKDPHRVLELTRIASDGSVKGASSMLAARLIDLVEVSRRPGAQGPAVLVTYSLDDEEGTTYRALRDKGMRPVRRVRARAGAGGGQRQDATTSLPTRGKIQWQAGPGAEPGDWRLLERAAGPAESLHRQSSQGSVDPDARMQLSPEDVKVAGYLDAFKVNDAPYELEERVSESGRSYTVKVYLPEAYTEDYMFRSSETGRLVRWAVRLQNGAIVSRDGVFRLRFPDRWDDIRSRLSAARGERREELAAKILWKGLSEPERQAMLNSVDLGTFMLMGVSNGEASRLLQAHLKAEGSLLAHLDIDWHRMLAGRLEQTYLDPFGGHGGAPLVAWVNYYVARTGLLDQAPGWPYETDEAAVQAWETGPALVTVKAHGLKQARVPVLLQSFGQFTKRHGWTTQAPDVTLQGVTKVRAAVGRRFGATWRAYPSARESWPEYDVALRKVREQEAQIILASFLPEDRALIIDLGVTKALPLLLSSLYGATKL